MQVETRRWVGFNQASRLGRGTHALVAEWIGTRLSAWLGLLTFDHGAFACPALDLPDGSTSRPGLAFVSRHVVGQAWGGTADDQLAQVENPSDIAGLVVVDTWTRNHDRYVKRGDTVKRNVRNVFFTHEGCANETGVLLVAMDFTCSIRCDASQITRHGCGIDARRQEVLFGLFPEFGPYVKEADLRHHAARLAEFGQEDARRIVGSVPPAWDFSEEAMEFTRDFLTDRAHFLAEHLIGLWRAEAVHQAATPDPASP